jgi:2-dehydro-3-deoxygalactonokinase
MELFLSCDWGTSAFRLRLVRMQDLQVLGELKTDQGIGSVHASWREQTALDRQQWYKRHLMQQVEQLWIELGMDSLAEMPLVISGMASSSIGMMELPYALVPAGLDGSGLKTEWLDLEGMKVLIISGLRTESDVMRGEETKLVGLLDQLPASERDQLILLPGTHPKHVVVRNRQVVGFQTYMTGEFFALLSSSGILAASVEKAGDLSDLANRESFINAVIRSRELPVLHHSFLVRTNQLLFNKSKEENYHYLSGLLIGEELKAIKGDSVYLLGSQFHTSLYALACEVLGIEVAGVYDADEALLRGQREVLQ